MRIEALGDRAVILSELPASAPEVARGIEQSGWKGILDVVPCGESVGVYFDEWFDVKLFSNPLPLSPSAFVPARHRIPICFERGEDFNRVAKELGLEREAFAQILSNLEVACFAIGFCPGFAYLGPVPEEIQGIRRLPSPRVRTEPGSLGLTGFQTAVYPLARPGGWPLIGQTPLTIVDEVDEYFPISVGDIVNLRRIDELEFSQLRGERL